MLIWEAYSPRMIDALAFSPSGRELAMSGYYLACRVIDAGTGARLWTADGRASFGMSLAFGPPGTVMCRDDGLSMRAADTGAEVRRCGQWCRAFALAPDGRTAYATEHKGRDLVRRYELESGEVRGTIELDSGAINRLAVSPNGRFVATVGCKRFHLLEVPTLKSCADAAHRALSTGMFALAFNPDGRTLVYSAGRTLFVWDIASARAITELHLESKHFLDAAFTPDGRRLLTVSREGAVRVWDTATWTCERSFEWAVGPLRAVAVAPDGTRAAVAGDTGRVVVWDLDV